MKHAVAIALVAACSGKELHHTVDALPADVQGDTLGASTDDAPPGAVKLNVKRGNDNVANVAVFFQDPSSGLIDQKLTNENGLAWALMPNGGFVTGVEHIANGIEEVTTFAAVAPGDSLRLDFMSPEATKSWPIELSFTADATGAASYRVRSSCGMDVFNVVNPAPVTPGDNQLTLNGCADGVADFVIESLDGDDNPTGQALYAGGVTLPAATGGTFAMLALPGGFAANVVHTLDYTNVPDTLSAINMLHAVSATRRAYQFFDSASRTSSTVSMTHSMPAGAPTHLVVSIGFPASSTESGQPRVIDWGATNPAYTLDLATAFLPRYLTAPAYDTTTHAITWSEATATTQPDFVRARIHVNRDDFPTGRTWGWRIIAPRSAAASLEYPVLPIVDFDFNPKAGDIVGVDELTNVKMPGGYAGWRPTAFGSIPDAVSGTSGRIVCEMLYVPEL